MNMNMMLVAALMSGNPRKRKQLMSMFSRWRTRSMQKWHAILRALIGLYFVWKGGGLKVKNGAGNEVDITDPSLTDTERLAALAQQTKVNSNDNRWQWFLLSVLDIVFNQLDDNADFELAFGELAQSMDWTEAPTAEQLATLLARYQQSLPVATTNGSNGSNGMSNSYPLGSPQNPIRVDPRRGGL